MRVVLIAAQSLDGFITKHDIPGSAFASAEDQAHLRESLRHFDCSIMGAETYRSARDLIRDRMSAPRLRMVLTRTPETFRDDTRPGVLEFSNAAPDQLLTSLSARGCSTCALLGGGQIHRLFLDAGRVHELWLTIEPVLFGKGTPLVAGAVEQRLRLRAQEKLSADTLLLKYEVLR